MRFNIENYSADQIQQLVLDTRGTIIIPIGAIEQHGDHLPIGTDTFVAEALANSVSEEANVAVAPTISWGWSPHHMARPGTITIRPEILMGLLEDIVYSLAEHGFKNFILINGHRIVNVIWIQMACQKIQSKLNVEMVLFDPAYMSKDLPDKFSFGPIGHAEEIETSHMMYIDNELVDLSKAVDNPVKSSQFYSVDPSFIHDTLCYIPTPLWKVQKEVEETAGVTGEPSKASTEAGKYYHDYLLNNLVKVVENIQER